MLMDEMREKYGDATVLGVAEEHIKGALKDGFTAIEDVEDLDATLAAHLESRLRCEAEMEPSFKQIIPYLILNHTPSGRTFATLRTGGDDRLIGQASLGLGGHMDEGESFEDCLFREIFEEVGLQPEEIKNLRLCGYIFSEASEVDSVHVGIVYRADTERDDLTCLEDDKLTGAWLTPHELIVLNCEGKLESWSRIVFGAMLREEAPYAR